MLSRMACRPESLSEIVQDLPLDHLDILEGHEALAADASRLRAALATLPIMDPLPILGGPAVAGSPVTPARSVTPGAPATLTPPVIGLVPRSSPFPTAESAVPLEVDALPTGSSAHFDPGVYASHFSTPESSEEPTSVPASPHAMPVPESPQEVLAAAANDSPGLQRARLLRQLRWAKHQSDLIELDQRATQEKRGLDQQQDAQRQLMLRRLQLGLELCALGRRDRAATQIQKMVRGYHTRIWVAGYRPLLLVQRGPRWQLGALQRHVRQALADSEASERDMLQGQAAQGRSEAHRRCADRRDVEARIARLEQERADAREFRRIEAEISEALEQERTVAVAVQPAWVGVMPSEQVHMLKALQAKEEWARASVCGAEQIAWELTEQRAVHGQRTALEEGAWRQREALKGEVRAEVKRSVLREVRQQWIQLHRMRQLRPLLRNRSPQVPMMDPRRPPTEAPAGTFTDPLVQRLRGQMRDLKEVHLKLEATLGRGDVLRAAAPAQGPLAHRLRHQTGEVVQLRKDLEAALGKKRAGAGLWDAGGSPDALVHRLRREMSELQRVRRELEATLKAGGAPLWARSPAPTCAPLDPRLDAAVGAVQPALFTEAAVAVPPPRPCFAALAAAVAAVVQKEQSDRAHLTSAQQQESDVLLALAQAHWAAARAANPVPHCVLIQAHARARLAVVRVTDLQLRRSHHQQEAAVHVQRCVRGHIARRHVWRLLTLRKFMWGEERGRSTEEWNEEQDRGGLQVQRPVPPYQAGPAPATLSLMEVVLPPRVGLQEVLQEQMNGAQKELQQLEGELQAEITAAQCVLLQRDMEVPSLPYPRSALEEGRPPPPPRWLLGQPCQPLLPARNSPPTSLYPPEIVSQLVFQPPVTTFARILEGTKPNCPTLLLPCEVRCC